MTHSSATIFICINLLLAYVNCLNADDKENKISNAINSFSINLYKKLTKSNQNMICSGYSAATILTMLLEGARTDTAKELSKTLGYDVTGLPKNEIKEVFHQILTKQRNHNSHYDLDIANSMWIQSGFKVLPDFKTNIRKIFYAEEREVDFRNPEATDEINRWVNQQTKGKIATIFDKPLGEARVVLVNAMHFNGTWQMRFNKTASSYHRFKFNNGQSKKNIKMMNMRNDFNYGYDQDLDAELLEMPYNGNDVSMVIVLPKTRDGLLSLEDHLTLEKLNSAIENLSTIEVKVKFPKFISTSTLALNQALKELGIHSAFMKREADLSGIDGHRNLSLSFVIQKATIEVDEDGTVADVATGGVMKFLSLERTISFVADHPFLYLILHKPTGLFLFIGRMTRPPN